MSKMFQIHTADLESLEADLPAIADALMPNMTNALRIRIRRVKEILSNVRWNYGPPTDVEVTPGEFPRIDLDD